MQGFLSERMMGLEPTTFWCLQAACTFTARTGRRAGRRGSRPGQRRCARIGLRGAGQPVRGFCLRPLRPAKASRRCAWTLLLTPSPVRRPAQPTLLLSGGSLCRPKHFLCVFSAIVRERLDLAQLHDLPRPGFRGSRPTEFGLALGSGAAPSCSSRGGGCGQYAGSRSRPASFWGQPSRGNPRPPMRPFDRRGRRPPQANPPTGSTAGMPPSELAPSSSRSNGGRRRGCSSTSPGDQAVEEQPQRHQRVGSSRRPPPPRRRSAATSASKVAGVRTFGQRVGLRSSCPATAGAQALVTSETAPRPHSAT
jgi:hypothetical protein